MRVAMKSASEALREKIYSSISKRAAETLRDEISMLGPVRLRDVEAAQDTIIQAVRRQAGRPAARLLALSYRVTGTGLHCRRTVPA